LATFQMFSTSSLPSLISMVRELLKLSF